jgi:hypothetical protein
MRQPRGWRMWNLRDDIRRETWVRIASGVRAWQADPVESTRRMEQTRTPEAMRTQGLRTLSYFCDDQVDETRLLYQLSYGPKRDGAAGTRTRIVV